VTGAPDGTLLDGGTVIVCVTVTSACGLDAADAAPEDTPGVPDGDVLADEAEASDEAELPEDAAAVPVDVLVTVGEMIVGVVGEEDEVQAETVTGASRIRAPQHSAVSLAPNGVPTVVPRTFMDPPPAPADDVLVPAPSGRNRNRKGNA
jgi:hypothetical protein